MPVGVVKTPKDEELWQKAKEIAEKEGQGKNWAYIMGIYERMKGKNAKKHIISVSGKILVKKKWLSPKQAAEYLVNAVREDLTPEEAWSNIENRVDMDGGEINDFIGHLKNLAPKSWKSFLSDEAIDYILANSLPDDDYGLEKSASIPKDKQKLLDEAYKKAYKDFHDNEDYEIPHWSKVAEGERGEVWKSSDGWGNFYFLLYKDRVKQIALRMPDVMAYHFFSPLKEYAKECGITRNTFKEKLGFGDSKWNTFMQHFVNGKKPNKAVKKSMEDKDREYSPSDRYAYKTHTKNPIYIPINRIRTPYQTEDALDEEKVKENISKMKAGKSLPALVIGYHYDLHDGHHRLEAAKRLGHTHVPCVVGGRNKRRVEAAKKRYQRVWKSMGMFAVGGRLIVKRVR